MKGDKIYQKKETVTIWVVLIIIYVLTALAILIAKKYDFYTLLNYKLQEQGGNYLESKNEN
jgi:predicted house-cleaning noncanonical NTP pyrophosphatase (MazG superfamily)